MHHIRLTLDVIEENNDNNQPHVSLSDLYEILVGVLRKDGYEVQEVHSSMYKEPPKIFIKKIKIDD